MPGTRALLRLVAFALCGAAGELLMLLVASAVTGPGSGFADVLPNVALSAAPGAAAGLVDGIGFALGDARRRSHPPAAPDEQSRGGTFAGCAIIAAVVALGCAFGLLDASGYQFVGLLAGWVAIAVVALAHGLVGGAEDGATAAGAVALGLLLGTGCGFLFGLSGGVTYVATYQPQAIRLFFGPGFGLIISLAFCTVVGVALGVVLACAQGVGRLLVPPQMTRAAAGGE
jgi:hypothetical protein